MYKLIYQYDLSNLGGCQFANQGILYPLTLYAFHYNQILKHDVFLFIICCWLNL
jgi:hypothetical protein